MSRFIDADALCEEFIKFVRKANNHDFEPTPNWNDAISIFHSMPTVDVVEVTNGEWLEKEVVDNTDEDFVWKIEQWQSARCSVCGKYHTTPYMYYFDHFNYCPNCGAKMERREDAN